MRFRRLLSSASHVAAAGRRLGRWVRRQPSGFLRVLAYHDIPAGRLGAFEAQLAGLAARYRFVDVCGFREMLAGRSPVAGGNLLLTFDDGFRSQRRAAETVLRRLGIRAVFFVAPEFAFCDEPGGRERFLVERLLRRWPHPGAPPPWLLPLEADDLRSLIREGHTIGSHTRSHARLGQEGPAGRLEDELLGSADSLEERLGIEIHDLAFPFGDVSREAVHVARRRYRLAFSAVRGSNGPWTNPMAIRRDVIDVDDPPGYVRFIVEGGLDLWYRAASRRLEAAAREP